MEVMTMASSSQGHGENDPAVVPRGSRQLPSLLSGDEVPGGSPPPPSAATGFGVSRNGTAVELPKLVGMNTLNPGSEKDEKEEAERRKQIMSMNQKLPGASVKVHGMKSSADKNMTWLMVTGEGKMCKMGPAAVRAQSSSSDDPRAAEAFPYQPQCFNQKPPSLRRVEVVGLSLPTLPSKNDALNPVQPTSRVPKDRSSTMAKEVPQSRRHGEMWSSADHKSTQKPKNFIIHTNRYQWDDLLHSPDGLTQKERIEVEQGYLDRMRSLKRKRELVPHRETHTLVMGGQKVIMTERMDIMGEIAKLKSVLLPARAKELYVGKGFRLPESHSLNNPRGFAVSILRPLRRGENISWEGEDERSPLSVVRDRGPVPKFSPLKVNLRIRTTPRNDQPYKHQVTTSKLLDKKKTKSATSLPDVPAPSNVKPPTKSARSLPKSDQYAGDISAASTMGDLRVGNPVPVTTPVSGVVSPNKSASPTKGPPINPLAVKEVEKFVSDEDLENLRKTFQNLSTKTQGKVNFDELKSHLPSELTGVELDYCKKVYEVSSSGNYFGEVEFVTLSCVCQKVVSLSGATKDAFQNLNMSCLGDSITQYAELFQSVDRHQKGKVSVDSLKEILCTTTGMDLKSDSDKFSELTSAIGITESTDITKTDFLALVPYFLTLETKP